MFFIPKAKKNVFKFTHRCVDKASLHTCQTGFIGFVKSVLNLKLEAFFIKMMRNNITTYFLAQTHSSYFRFSHLVVINLEFYFIFLLVWDCYCRAMHINVAGFKKPKYRESTLHFPSIWQRE